MSFKEHPMGNRKEVRLGGCVMDRSRHVCAFFHSREEEYRVLLPFIREGFEQGDRAFHLIDKRNRTEHVRRLADAGIDVADAQSRSQLDVRPWEDAYLQDGCFDQYRQVRLIERALAEGKSRGFPLTRLVADMEWALEECPGVHDIVEYETRLNYVLPRYDDAVCCVYDLNRFPAHVVIDILRTHPAVILGGVLHENPLYVPPDQMLAELRERGGASSTACAPAPARTALAEQLSAARN
jgi:hypothetical protein